MKKLFHEELNVYFRVTLTDNSGERQQNNEEQRRLILFEKLLQIDDYSYFQSFFDKEMSIAQKTIMTIELTFQIRKN